jgi:glycosyltransferase involved in cell wall biosynthesis
VARVSEALARVDIDVTVITSTQKKRYFRCAGVSVKAIVDSWDFRGWNKIVNEVIKGSFDAVHFEYPTRYPVPRNPILRYIPLTVPFIFLSALKLKNIHRIITVHEYYQSGFLARIKVFLDALFSNKIIVVTPIDQKRLSGHSFLQGKIHFMPVGPNILIHEACRLRIQEVRSLYKVGIHEKVICFFGFLAPSRGFEDLICAVQIIVKTGIRVRVFVIGVVSDKLYLAALQDIVSSKGLGYIFEWLGFVREDRIADYIQACDITIQPYLHGATTNRSSLIAAIALNVPTVSTYVEGTTPEYFCHEQNMLLVPPNSPEKIANEAMRLFIDQPLRAKIIEGMQDLAERFNWEYSARISAEIYRTLQ